MSSSSKSSTRRRNVGQRQTIARAISRTLDSYSDDQILTELLQNADDAGATKAAFMIDERTHSTRAVFKGGRMEELQGPALCAFNDEIFRDEHFDGLLSFGQGSKDLDPTKTGKFGLGFNSVYHVTECPMFVSGDWFLCLDPQKKYYPGLGAGDEGGMMLQPQSENAELLRDQFAPFECEGLGIPNPLSKYVDGTFFRFPLRNKKQARDSVLRKNAPFSISKLNVLFRHFERDAALCILFLKSVTRIDLLRWKQGATSPERIFHVEMRGDSELQKKRIALTAWLKKSLDAWSKKNGGLDWKKEPQALVQTLRSSKPSDIPRATRKVSLVYGRPGGVRHEVWAIRDGVGRGRAWDLATSMDAGRRDQLALWPAASVAALVSTSGSVLCTQGRAFAGLPTPIRTGYPVHVNARWCLSDNRNTLQGTTHAKSQAIEKDFNSALVTDVVCELWVELLNDIRSFDSCSTSYFYNLFPRRACVQGKAIFEEILKPFYIAISKGHFLISKTSGKWLGVRAGFWESSLTPLPDNSHESRASWLQHIMIMESNAFICNRTGHLNKSDGSSKTTQTELPPPPPFLARSSSYRRRERNYEKLQRYCRYFTAWIREQGNVRRTLHELQCPFLIETPRAILDEMKSVGKANAACKFAREVDPADIREFLRDRWSEEAEKLTKIFMRDIRRLTGLLRFCSRELRNDACPTSLIGLPIPVLRRGQTGYVTLGIAQERSTIRFSGFYRDESDSNRVFEECVASDVDLQTAISRFARYLRKEGRTHGFFGLQAKSTKCVELRTSLKSRWWRRGRHVPDDEALAKSTITDSPQLTDGCDGEITFLGSSAGRLNAVYILHLPCPRRRTKGDLVLVKTGSSARASRLLPDATFVHERVRTIFRPFCKGLAAETLGLEEFGPKMLSRRLETTLPAEWKNRPIVKSNDDVDRWCRTLFLYLKLNSVTDVFFAEKTVESWPILPCEVATGKILISPLFSKVVLRQPDSGAVLGRKGRQMWEIAKKLNLPILDRFVPLGAAGINVLTPKRLLIALSEAKKHLSKELGILDTLREMQASDRLGLLEVFEDCVDELEDSLLLNLRTLPIFPLVSDSGRTHFAPLKTGKKYYILPSRIKGIRPSSFESMGVLSEELMARVPCLCRTFHMSSLTFAKYYRAFVFPNFANMSDEEILAHMNALRMVFDSICEEDATFETLCRNIPFVRADPKQALRSARELLDPTVPIFRSYFDKGDFPPESYSITMLKFLRRLGMLSTFGADTFLKCAWDVARRRDVTRAKELLAYLSRHYDDFSAEVRENDETTFSQFFEQLSYLPIVPVATPPLSPHPSIITSKSPFVLLAADTSKDRVESVVLGLSWRLSFNVPTIVARVDGKESLVSIKSSVGKDYIVAVDMEFKKGKFNGVVVDLSDPSTGSNLRILSNDTKMSPHGFNVEIVARNGKHVQVKIDGKIVPLKSPGVHSYTKENLISRDFSIFASRHVKNVSYIAWETTAVHIEKDRWPVLMPARFVANSADKSFAWSQIPILDWPRYGRGTRVIGISLRRRLKMRLPSISEVLAHAIVLCDTLNGGSAGLRASSIMSDYLRTLIEMNHGLSDLTASSGRLAEMIKTSLSSRRCIPLARSNCLVRPNQIFATTLAEDVKPYAFDHLDVHRDLRYMTRLLTALGATESTPRAELVRTWISDMKKKSGDRALSPDAFALVVRLIRLFVSRRLADDAAGEANDAVVFVPDEKGVMRSSEALVARDAPWLEKRIQMSLLPLSHAKILSIPGASSTLRIASLSRCVRETIEPGFVPKIIRTKDVDKINVILKSTSFRNGIRRLILHENLTNPSTDPTGALTTRVLEKLCGISSIEVVGVEKLRTIFLHEGVDVTKDPTGAMYAYDETRNLLFLRVSNVPSYRVLPSLCLALRDVLEVDLRNLQPVEKMLSVDAASEIPHVLDFLRITKRTDESSAFLGLPLDRETLNCLDRITSSDLKQVDINVAFKNKNGEFCYGKLVGFDGRVVRVEVSSESTQTFVPSDIFRIRDRSEMRAADMEQSSTKEDTNEGVSDGKSVDDEDVEVTILPSEIDDAKKEDTDEEKETPRKLYELSDEWWDSENKLQEVMRKENAEVEKTLEKQLPGVDNVLRRLVKIDPSKVATSVSVGKRVKRGHDLVRVGNFADGVAFFIARGSSLTAPLKKTLLESADVLRDVCRCFSYNHKYITLFWQPNAISRFTRQKILINIWPIDERKKAVSASGKAYDARKDVFPYMYIYGLLIHKLGHFHDAVHGTRHNFYMQELRYEFNEEWIEMMESKGFDMGALESSGEYDRQLWGTQF